MFTAVQRYVSNTLAGISFTSSGNGNNINLAGCCIRKLTRTANGGGLKAAVTTVLLFIMATLYCLYGTGSSTGSAIAPVANGLQSLSSSDSVKVQPDVIAVIAAEASDGRNSHTNIPCGGKNSKKPKKKQPKMKLPNRSGVLTAADMYEPGFRIKNADICSPRTRLLVLITSAAAPEHSQHRQAIRMTWMNRYGPGVSMAFLVGTPQISETDPVAQVLEAEEQALRTRLNRIDNNNIDKTKENPGPKPSPSAAMASGAAEALVDPMVGDSGWFRFLRDREQNSGEGLDAQSMLGLNAAERAVQRVLGREHGRYGDLVQCHVRDTYNNLTLKSIAALEWTRQYCPWAKYLLKTDDDMFIDVRRLLRFIDKVETEAITKTGVNIPRPLEPVEPSEFYSMDVDGFETPVASDFDIDLPPTIWGRLAHGWRPIRKQNSKYFVSRLLYTSRVYPDFCTGPAYLMTRSAVNPLYEGALGRDFDIVDDEDEDLENKNDEVSKIKNRKDNKDLGKGCADSNQTLDDSSDNVVENNNFKKNIVPYLKLEDVYLTGIVAERLTRRAVERLARQERKEKEKMTIGGSNNNQNSGKTASGSLDDTKKFKSKTSDIIVQVRRIHDDQFANKKISGRALERAVCSGVSPGDTVGTGGSGSFSWFRWYWGDTTVEKNSKKKKKDQGVISLHMVKYSEQFDLWRRLMDGRSKCKS